MYTQNNHHIVRHWTTKRKRVPECDTFDYWLTHDITLINTTLCDSNVALWYSKVYLTSPSSDLDLDTMLQVLHHCEKHDSLTNNLW